MSYTVAASSRGEMRQWTFTVISPFARRREPGKRRVRKQPRQRTESVETVDKPEITEFVNAQMPLGATLGIRSFGGAEEVDATLEWAPGLCTAAGLLHGGVLMALAD